MIAPHSPYRRVVEVFGALTGSGYVIAGDAILTARHLLTADGECEIRALDSADWIPAKVSHERDDLAVVRAVGEPWRDIAKRTPMRWALVNQRDRTPFRAVGFPWATARPDGIRETDEIWGTLLPGAGLKTQRLVLNVETAAPADRPDGSPWAGLSGAAVLAVPGGQVCGVVVADPDRVGKQRLIALPIETLVGKVVENPDRLDAGTPPFTEPYQRLPQVYPEPWLLDGRFGVVPFIGRAEELGQLTEWCGGERPFSLGLVTGDGGAGKSRLVSELCVRMRGEGWQAGMTRPEVSIDWDQFDPDWSTLMVFDYSERFAASIVDGIKALTYRRDRPPVRLLLVERTAGSWWEWIDSSTKRLASLLLGVRLDLRAEDFSEDQRTDHAKAAVEAFAVALGKPPAEPPDVGSTELVSPLLVHIAALLRVHGAADMTSRGTLRAHLLTHLLDREEQRWRASRDRLDLGAVLSDRLVRQAVVIATLVTPRRKTAADLLSTLRLADPVRLADTVAWLVELFPSDDGMAALRPDLVVEELLGRTDGLSELVAQVYDHPVCTAAERIRILQTLIVAGQHGPAPRGALGDLVAVRLATMVAEARDDSTFGAVLRAGLDLTGTMPAVAEACVALVRDQEQLLGNDLLSLAVFRLTARSATALVPRPLGDDLPQWPVNFTARDTHVPRPPHPPDGQLPPALTERFTFVRRLGEGPESQVVVVRDALGESYVVKLYVHGLHPDQVALVRAAALTSPHLIRTYEVGELDGQTYELQEYYRAGTLRELLRTNGGPLPVAVIVDVVRQVTGALRMLHAAQVVHRDIKPDNLLLRSTDPIDLVLADFGISRLLDGPPRAGGEAMTASYAAPEVWVRTLPTPALDWWALGVTVLEMATGRPAFAGLGEREVAAQVLTRGLDVTGVDPRLRTLCAGLLTRDADRRWGSREVIDWLADAVPAVPAAAPRERRRLIFGGRALLERKAVAQAFAARWPAAVDRFINDRDGHLTLAHWLQQDEGDPGLEPLLAALADLRVPSDLRMLTLVRWLHPGLPPVYRGWSMTPADLAGLARTAVATYKVGDFEEVVKELEPFDLLMRLAEFPGGEDLANVGERWAGLREKLHSVLTELEPLCPAATTDVPVAAAWIATALLGLAVRPDEVSAALRGRLATFAHDREAIAWYRGIVDWVGSDAVRTLAAVAWTWRNANHFALRNKVLQGPAYRRAAQFDLRRRTLDWSAAVVCLLNVAAGMGILYLVGTFTAAPEMRAWLVAASFGALGVGELAALGRYRGTYPDWSILAVTGLALWGAGRWSLRQVAERGTSSTVVFMPIVASIVAVCCCPQVLPVVMVIGYVIAAIVRDVVWQRHRNTRMAWLQDPDTYLNAMERAAGERGRR